MWLRDRRLRLRGLAYAPMLSAPYELRCHEEASVVAIRYLLELRLEEPIPPEIDAVLVELERLMGTLCDRAEREADTLMPGFTHLQTAQPVTFGHHLLA